MQYDITMIGHVCKDTLIYKEERSEDLGGAVYYSSIAASGSGVKVHVVTMASDSDDKILDVMRNRNVHVTRISSEDTTRITLKYYTPDKERRDIILEKQASPFSIDSFPDVESRIYHLAGLFKGEIPDNFIPFLSVQGDVALDVQGVIRCCEEGNLVFREWNQAEKLLPYIKYLKTDAAEAEILTGKTDREKAALILHRMGADEVMVTHNSEVIVCVGGKIFKAPFNPSNLSGRTGRGDTTFAAYLSKRLTADPLESLYFAAALCSIKMETPGPFNRDLGEVFKRMDTLGYKAVTKTFA